MPTITLGAGAIYRMNYGFLTVNAGYIAPTLTGLSAADVSAITASIATLTSVYSTGNAPYFGTLSIMKEAPPTSLTEIPNWNARLSDVLVTYNSKTTPTVFNPTTSTTNLYLLTPSVITEYQTATGSGTATWFMFMTRAYSDTGTTAPIHRVVGSIGLEGSGADLIMNNTTITAGDSVRVSNLQLSLAGPWTY